MQVVVHPGIRWSKANESVISVVGVLVVGEDFIGADNEEVGRDHFVVASGVPHVVREGKSGRVEGEIAENLS